MGDGVLDGRGGAKLLGHNVTWWDLAREAKVKDLSQNRAAPAGGTAIRQLHAVPYHSKELAEFSRF
jgi:hypothetical protein